MWYAERDCFGKISVFYSQRVIYVALKEIRIQRNIWRKVKMAVTINRGGNPVIYMNLIETVKKYQNEILDN